MFSADLFIMSATVMRDATSTFVAALDEHFESLLPPRDRPSKL
jgi:hypothetical protein